MFDTVNSITFQPGLIYRYSLQLALDLDRVLISATALLVCNAET